MDSGRIEGQVDSARARRFGLPRGDQKLRLSLGAGMVGVVSSGAKVQQVLWAAEKNEMFEVRTSAERLTLLNLKDEATPFVIQALSVSASDTIGVSLERPFEERQARHGTVVVPAEDSQH